MRDFKIEHQTQNKPSPIFTIVVIVIFILVFGIGIAYALYQDHIAKLNYKAYEINETVNINNTCLATVTDVSTDTIISYNSFGLPTVKYANNYFTIIKFNIQNLTKNTLPINSDNFVLTMDGGYVYNTPLLLSSEGFDLVPLQAVSFTLVFDTVYQYTEQNYTLTFKQSSWLSEGFSCDFKLY